jgi:hypothetical protein
VADRTVRLGKDDVKLSLLSRIELGETTTILTYTGREETGQREDFQSIPVDFGGYVAKLDLSKATRIIITGAPAGVSEISYRIVAKLDGVQVGELRGEIPIEGQVLSRDRETRRSRCRSLPRRKRLSNSQRRSSKFASAAEGGF